MADSIAPKTIRDWGMSVLMTASMRTQCNSDRSPIKGIPAIERTVGLAPSTPMMYLDFAVVVALF